MGACKSKVVNINDLLWLTRFNKPCIFIFKKCTNNNFTPKYSSDIPKLALKIKVAYSILLESYRRFCATL